LIDKNNVTQDELDGVPDIDSLQDVPDDEPPTQEDFRESALPIIECGNVLRHCEAAWRVMVAGEVRNAKLLYLVATSRLFDRCMHCAIKGPSSAGKSEIRKRVLSFFPSEHVLSFTTLSERSLLYFEQDFCHLILSMGEAAGADEQQLQDYLLRELMSEGKLRYPVPVKAKGGMQTVIIEKNGPVCFLVTTTKDKLHQENETRMLSLEVDDSDVQTKAVLSKVAEVEGLNRKTHAAEYRHWQDFQRWLALGNCRVVVPYASALAGLIEPKSVRLRRDFTQLLMAVKAHALLHREHRHVDETGEIIATIHEDYAVVCELMSDVMAEGSETKIKETVLETVAAVRKAQTKADGGGVNAQEVGKYCGWTSPQLGGACRLLSLTG
jgi:hypothetical protein